MSPPTAIVLPGSPAVLAVRGRLPAVRRYGWPIRPFNREHAIRGGFGDPRFGLRQRNFHFGIDIPAPGGTPVYAVAAGTAVLAPDRVAVLSPAVAKRATGFTYWHILPAVAEYHYVRKHALIGWVSPTWGHLHFAELDKGALVNPLRPGALTPFRDTAIPRIDGISVLQDPPTPIPGDARPAQTVDVTVDAFLPPAVPPPPLWHGARLAPALIRWRLLDGATPESRWTTAVDFRRALPPNTTYRDVYAPGSRPNRPGRPGRYIFVLAHRWNVTGINLATDLVQVQVLGPRGATAFATASLRFGVEAISSELRRVQRSGAKRLSSGAATSARLGSGGIVQVAHLRVEYPTGSSMNDD